MNGVAAVPLAVLYAGDAPNQVFRRDGTGLRQLTGGDYRDRWPAWSPDGKRLAFYCNRSGKFDAWTIRPDGSGLQQLTFTPDGFVVNPVWGAGWEAPGLHDSEPDCFRDGPRPAGGAASHRRSCQP
jgi:hypothetical protein